MHSKIGKSIKRLGGFVTLLAVSATSVAPPAAAKDTTSIHPYEGKKYVYVTDYEDGISTYDKKGRIQDAYTFIPSSSNRQGGMGAVYKTKSYLYYCDTNVGFSDTGYIWQVPVKKKTEKLNVKRQRRLFKVPKWQEFVKADDNKIIYQCDRTIMVYDKRTKKKKKLVKVKDNEKRILMAKTASGRTAKAGNCVYYTVRNIYRGTNDGLYQLNLKTGKKKKIASSVNTPWRLRSGQDYGKSNPIIGVNGKNVYLSTNDSLVRYNTKTGKAKKIVKNQDSSSAGTGKSLNACITANAGVNNIKTWDVMGMWFYKKKMYMEIRVKYNYKAQNDEEGTCNYDQKNMIISVNKKDGKKLRYEKGVSQFLAKPCGVYKDSDYDMIKNWVNHTGSMLTFTSEGVWIGEFMSGDGFNQYFVYDIKTGKQTTYSKRKAILILAKQGIDDDYQPTIC